MPTLTDAQFEGLADPILNLGTEIDHAWQDPHPDAPCWGWALFGGPGGHANNTPPIINDMMLNNVNGNLQGVNPGFRQWVADTFQNQLATNEATIIQENFSDALILLDENAQQGCSEAFAKLCAIVSGLTIATVPTRYSIVMASDHWYTWEHWALGLANNINAPNNPAVQFTQRDTENPVNTRCEMVWGDHPILTTVYIDEVSMGHITYLQHAVGWPQNG